MNPLEAALHEIWCDTLGVDEIDLDSDFFELGGDSLASVEVFGAIAEELSIALPPSVMLELSTIRALASRLGQMLPDVESLVTIHGGGALTPLFVVHDAMGSVYFARHLSRHLGPDRPVYGLRPPAGGEITITDTTLEGLAAHYVDCVLSRWTGPVHLFGMSYGGTMAFEMALQLQARGHPVEFLSIGDMPAPSISYEEIAAANPATLPLGGDIPPSFVSRVGDRLTGKAVDDEPLLPGDPSELLALVRWRLSSAERRRRREDWQAREDIAQLPEYPTAAALMALLVRYRPSALFVGSALVVRTNDELKTWEFAPVEDKGWSEHVSGPIRVALVPCDWHHQLLEEPYIDQLGEVLARELGELAAERVKGRTTDLQ